MISIQTQSSINSPWKHQSHKNYFYRKKYSQFSLNSVPATFLYWFFSLLITDTAASWEEWWTYDGISGKLNGNLTHLSIQIDFYSNKKLWFPVSFISMYHFIQKTSNVFSEGEIKTWKNRFFSMCWYYYYYFWSIKIRAKMAC